VVFEDLGRPKWNLGWLGAIIVVVLIAGGVIYLLLRDSGGSEAAIREYYKSARGGYATEAALDRLHVLRCYDSNLVYDGAPVERCDLTVSEAEVPYTPCFTFDLNHDTVLAGPRELVDYRGCNPLVFDSRQRKFVLLDR
jgi:hypothetical protein